jgi:hypothetical protein
MQFYPNYLITMTAHIASRRSLKLNGSALPYKPASTMSRVILSNQNYHERDFLEGDVGQESVVLGSHGFDVVKTLVHVHSRKYHMRILKKLNGWKTSVWNVWVTARLLDEGLEVAHFEFVQYHFRCSVRGLATHSRADEGFVGPDLLFDLGDPRILCLVECCFDKKEKHCFHDRRLHQLAVYSLVQDWGGDE